MNPVRSAGPTPASRGRRPVSLAALGFAVTVIAELVAFVFVARYIGVGWTVLLVVATSLLGAFLLKREGTRAWTRFRDVQEAGGRPGPHLVRAVVGLGAALLLVVPGFLTDIAGLLLLIPPVRSLAGRGVGAVAAKRLNPRVVGDLFGPRRVKAKTGDPKTTDGPGADDVPLVDTTPIEGEIIDPR
jgi:UPF0716 protein FxsA